MKTPARRPAAPAPSGELSRSRFEQQLRSKFLVSEIRTGTFEEQAGMLTRPRGTPQGRDLTQAQWKPWDPGGASEVYQAILDGFERLADVFGGAPPVRTVLFFDQEYHVSSKTGDVEPDPDAGASFGGGVMTIYRAATRAKILPIARSGAANAAADRRTPGLLTVLGGGKGGAAGLLPTYQSESTSRNIVHELGHGLTEAVMARLDPQLIEHYAAAVGWRGNQLFDLGNPSTHITVDNWNDPAIAEQPISDYMVQGGPSEDFAEAVMAFVTIPAVLKARSPHRYDFIDRAKSAWQPLLIPVRRPGDFPQSRPNLRSV